MSTNVWQGERVRLRALEPEDAEIFYQWNLDSETARTLDFVWPPQSRAHVRDWVEKATKERPQNDSFDLVIETAGGVVVGQISTHHTDRRAGCFRHAFAIRPGYRGRGYAKEAVIILLRYFFEELGYQKCTATVYETNPASRSIHEGLGFQLEGRIRRVVYTRGRHWDELFYGITAEEFAAIHGSK